METDPVFKTFLFGNTQGNGQCATWRSHFWTWRAEWCM